ncbi:MAG: hypothetical protein JM58_09045 [Peptococcaceae bacterium BICA1-8]|nr:MAG: hypothetical protein JM58_09045 [Peptococcaceae bacterium BICA1-8]
MAKFKVKIINMVLIILLILLGTYFLLPNLLFSMARSYADEPEQKERAQILYQRIVEYFPKSYSAPEALYWLALSIEPPSYGSFSGGGIIITRHMTTSSMNQMEGVGIDVAINSYKTLLEKYPNSQYAEFVPLRLGELYYNLGRFDDAEKYLLQGLKNDNKRKFISSECNYKLIELYLKIHQSEKALEMVHLYRTNNPNSMVSNLYLLEGDAYRKLGEYKKAEATYNKVLDNLPKELPKEDFKANRDFLKEEVDARLIKNKLAEENNENEKGVIKGTVTREGAPLERVQIFLIDENRAREGFSTHEFQDAPYVFTDLWGRFELTGIIPGSYSLGLGLPKSYLDGYTLVPRPDAKFDISVGDEITTSYQLVPLIKTLEPQKGSYLELDSLTFSWESVVEAAYYQLEMGSIQRRENGVGYGSSVVKDKINSNKITLTQADLAQSKGISFDDEGVIPSSLFGIVFPGGEFVWNIKAFDKNDNYLGESSGYQFHIDKEKLSTFFTADEGLTDGDRLVMERKYDEAIIWYEEYLLNNSSNLHVLNMLSNLYNYHKEDWEKSKDYYELLYSLTNSQMYLERIALSLYHAGQYQDAIPYLKKVVEEHKGNWYFLNSLGRSYIINGDLEQGERYLADSVATGQCSRIDLVILKASQGKWQEAYSILHKLDNKYLNNFAPLELILKDLTQEKVIAPIGWQEFLLELIKNPKVTKEIDKQWDNPKFNELARIFGKSI